MKKFKMLSALILAAALLCGCQSTEETVMEASDTVGKISDKPITLSIYQIDMDAFDSDWPVFKQAQAWTNIELKGVLAKSTTDADQSFNMMMASGDVADIVVNWKENFNKYGMQKAFIPLQDLIDQYAPNIKKYLEENPEAKRFITARDGNIYYIPYVTDGKVQMTWFIRQDWLDKLGLEQPKTVEEYYNVLKAFSELDPNGNGKADEIPYFNRNVGANFEQSVTPLLMLWKAHSEIYINDAGEVCYGPLEPEFKEAMKNIAQWYKEGLLDEEIYTRSNARDVLLENNTGGSTHDWCGSTAALNNVYKDKIPGFNFVVMAPPGGVEYSARQQVGRNGWGIAASNEHPVETIKYFDFWFSPEGIRLANFGIEGEDYTMVDGKAVFTDSVLNGEKDVPTHLREKGAQRTIGTCQLYEEYELQWLDPIAREGAQMYLDNGYIKDMTFVGLPVSDDDQKAASAYYADLNTYVREQMQKWVLGSEDVDATYDSFISGLKQMKVDDYLELMKKSRANYMSK